MAERVPAVVSLVLVREPVFNKVILGILEAVYLPAMTISRESPYSRFFSSIVRSSTFLPFSGTNNEELTSGISGSFYTGQWALLSHQY